MQERAFGNAPTYDEAQGDDAVAGRGARARRPAVRVVVTQARPGMLPPRTTSLMIETARPAHVSCANPDCLGGGIDPLPLIRELLDAGADELRVASCEGRARTAGNGRGARCDTMFCISVATGEPPTP